MKLRQHIRIVVGFISLVVICGMTGCTKTKPSTGNNTEDGNQQGTPTVQISGIPDNDGNKDQDGDNLNIENDQTSSEKHQDYIKVDGYRPFTFDHSQRYQEIEGFGASYTWFSDMLFQCDDTEGAYDALFSDAKLTIVRFKNEYEYYNEDMALNASTMLTYYEEANKRAAEYGEKPIVLLCCWGPPAKLKEGNNRTGATSLKKDENGNYCYEEYAKWWVESLEYYRAQGIPVDYICIQNEVELAADFDGCRFDYKETEKCASFAKAFLAVYYAMQERFGDAAPKMLGPECMSCEANTIYMYMKEILETEPDSVYGIAHHLYVGGKTNSVENQMDPDSFTMKLLKLYDKYMDLPRWQTEFYVGHGIDTATLINNCMVYEQANVYLYWSGVWQENSEGAMETDSLISCCNGRANWLTKTGWRRTADYYAMRHFSEFIRPGYNRIQCTTKDRDVRSSTYISKDGSKVVVVIINVSNEEKKYYLHGDNYNITSTNVYQSVFGNTCTSEDKLWQDLGAMNDKYQIVLPSKSVTTIDITGMINQ